MIIQRPAVAIALLIGGALSVSGCSAFSETVINCSPTQANNDSTIKVDVVALLAPSDSFTDFEIALDVAQSGLVDTLGWEGSRLSTILADGSPEIKKSALIESRGNENDGRILASQNANQLTTVYSCAIQDPGLEYSSSYSIDPETDFLQSFTIAARAFDAEAQSANRQIIVVGNGLQSVGQLNFAKDGLPTIQAIPGIIQSLEADGALPDLQGATVDWIGLGQTDGQVQEKLNQQSQDALLAFWKAFIAASNGREGTFQMQVAAGTPSPGSISSTAVESLPDACLQATLTEAEGFEFGGNSSDFVNLAKARAGAERIASELAAKSDCTGTITVIGYTASGVDEVDYKFGDNLALSLSRAKAFRALLVEAGVKAEIQAIGGGKGPVKDWDDSGKFSETLGKQNRIVVVTQQ
jgi:outer membrane protein OmpA-like peptidoglycan-associated protein